MTFRLSEDPPLFFDQRLLIQRSEFFQKMLTSSTWQEAKSGASAAFQYVQPSSHSQVFRSKGLQLEQLTFAYSQACPPYPPAPYHFRSLLLPSPGEIDLRGDRDATHASVTAVLQFLLTDHFDAAGDAGRSHNCFVR